MENKQHTSGKFYGDFYPKRSPPQLVDFIGDGRKRDHKKKQLFIKSMTTSNTH